MIGPSLGLAVLVVHVAAVSALAVVQPAAKASLKRSVAGGVKPVIDGMREARIRLEKKDAGVATRNIQERVVGDLQRLIDAASQDSSQQGAGGQPQNPADAKSAAQRGDEIPRDEPMQSPATSKTRRKSEAEQLPGPVSVPPGTGATSARRQVWGHLPPALRSRVSADFGEVVLPAYDDLVRRYFDALLDESQPPGQKAGSGRGASSGASPAK